jgi:hypothetical protein
MEHAHFTKQAGSLQKDLKTYFLSQQVAEYTKAMIHPKIQYKKIQQECQTQTKTRKCLSSRFLFVFCHLLRVCFLNPGLRAISQGIFPWHLSGRLFGLSYRLS